MPLATRMAVSELSRIAMLATHARIMKGAGLYDDDDYDDLSDSLVETLETSLRHMDNERLISGWTEEEFVRALYALAQADMFSADGVAPPTNWLATAVAGITRDGTDPFISRLKIKTLEDTARRLMSKDAVKVFGPEQDAARAE